MEKAPTRAFSLLKVSTTAFTFKNLLRHYAKRALVGAFSVTVKTDVETDGSSAALMIIMRLET